MINDKYACYLKPEFLFYDFTTNLNGTSILFVEMSFSIFKTD